MRILFIHGLASSGAYKLADMLRINLKADVLAPDVPIDPDEALALLSAVVNHEQPDLVVGLSWGGFLALRLQHPRIAVINPDLHISRILRQHIGPMDYLSPRRDGETQFLITEPLCRRYEQLESAAIPAQSPLGLFATEDELVHCAPEFERLYPGCTIKYPGKHLPTFPEVKKFIAPALLTKFPKMSNIDNILAFNREYVASKGYEKHITDKYPDKKLAILSCMDTRLSVLLPEALGLQNGDAKIIKNAGAVVLSPWDSVVRSLIVAVYELGVKEIMVVAHTTCGACHMSFSHFREEMLERGIPESELSRTDVDLHAWLEGFKDTEDSVRKTIDAIVRHPLIPRDIVVRGFIIDSVTGALTEIQ